MKYKLNISKASQDEHIRITSVWLNIPRQVLGSNRKYSYV